MFDAFVRGLARLALKIFFRKVEVFGLDRFPGDAPVLAVANHENSLIDAVLVVGALPRMPRFLGKSTLWKIAPLRPFLKLGKVIPVYRRQDVGEDMSKNQETFARCHEELRDGGLIAMFPEGISHNEPGLQPLKTGAARIALEAEDRFGPLGVRIVPIGLEWEDKGRFRSRALVQIGEPLAPDAPRPDSNDPRVAARRLTERIEEGLRSVTVNYESWREARLLARAADLYGRRESEIPGAPDLVRRTGLRKTFLAGYRSLRDLHPEAIARVENRVEEYDTLLRASGLRDDQISSHYPWSKIVLYLLKTLYQFTLRLPLAFLGIVLCWLPYGLTDTIARRFSPSPDTVSTYKLFPGIVLYPLCWLGEALAVAWAAGTWWGFPITLLAAPITGWVAMRYQESRNHFLTETRAFLKLFLSRSLSRDLQETRRQVRADVEELVELHRLAKDGDSLDAGEGGAGSGAEESLSI